MLDIKNLFKPVKSWTTEDIIAEQIRTFDTSEARKWMIIGENYYKGDNDIVGREIIRHTDKGPLIDPTKPNNKLAHTFMKNLVDEKVSYLLGRPFSMYCKDEGHEDYLELIKDTLGKKFQGFLRRVGYEVSNKGIAFMYPYVDEDGSFKLKLFKSEQCIPIWKDEDKQELEGLIRYYQVQQYVGDELQYITKVEYYTPEGISYYILDETTKSVYADVEANPDADTDVIAYLTTEAGELDWEGNLPILYVKNNDYELPDVKFVKSLIDNYDLSTSDISNFLEEVKNLIYVLKGYGGQDLDTFLKDINYYRAIKIDDPETGGVDTLTPTMDITAAKEHFERLRRDIVDFGQGVTKDIDKFGSNPSGVAMKFIYASLDLKATMLETYLSDAFDQLLDMVDIYLRMTGQGEFDNIDVNILFNKDLQINDTEAITNCSMSVGIISDETIIENHPWVTDAQLEYIKLQKQKEEQRKQEKEMLTYNDTNFGEDNSEEGSDE